MKTKILAPAAAAASSPVVSTESALPSSIGAVVSWKSRRKVLRTAPVDGHLLDRELYDAFKFRTGNHYPRQRNYHGFFYFSQVGHHVWHESLLEATALMWLDLHEDIVAIACQPFEVTFSDGTAHIPDFIAMHGDGRQVVYDVKPAKYLDDEARLQFAKTRVICESVGWGYEIISDFSRQAQINLAWVGAFRHPAYHPGQAAVAQLNTTLGENTTVLEAARMLALPTLAQARSALYHLVAIQVLTLDLSSKLSDGTIVKATRS